MCLPRYQGKEGERDGEERSAAIEDGISALSVYTLDAFHILI